MVQAQWAPLPEEATLEQWMINRFGERLYRMFFKTYTEKDWGLPCSAIQADWAAQRIRGLSMAAIVANALFGTRSAKTLIDRFQYPRRGSGMMWDRFAADVAAAGGEIRTEATVIGFRHAAGRITGLQVRRHGALAEETVHRVISSMPLADLVLACDPVPPAEVLAAAAGLSYRALVMVGLVLQGGRLFPDQWLYIHDPDVGVGRIQNFRNWSQEMAPPGDATNVGMEYFCNEGDATWNMPDNALIDQASRELAKLGLARRRDVMDGLVVRQPRAYPVYDRMYRRNLAVIRHYLEGFENLQTIGRNGTHRYSNMDHAMQSGILAAENVLRAGHDLEHHGSI